MEKWHPYPCCLPRTNYVFDLKPLSLLHLYKFANSLTLINISFHLWEWIPNVSTHYFSYDGVESWLFLVQHCLHPQDKLGKALRKAKSAVCRYIFLLWGIMNIFSPVNESILKLTSIEIHIHRHSCQRDVLPNSRVSFQTSESEWRLQCVMIMQVEIHAHHITSKRWISADQLHTNTLVMRAKSKLQGNC